ncbi:hypothetical protein A5708_24975 [Mycobacterium colombiense]|uniref:Uncharacterized protein n=1 Tax=Mycobacterium colombiense TaxID=339268 RepID=A0A1A2YU52_9MYCO|nr:hypothetical protein A5708_24975 [Mycobacterium colombiense]
MLIGIFRAELPDVGRCVADLPPLGSMVGHRKIEKVAYQLRTMLSADRLRMKLNAPQGAVLVLESH